MDHIYLPEELQKMVAGQPFRLDNVGLSGSRVLLFEDKVLKIRPAAGGTRSEHTMMRWLDGKLPVPRCLYHTVENGVSYLLMTKIHGKMSCDEEYTQNPEALVRILAEGLKGLWQVDISNCPVKWDLDNKLAAAKAYVDQGSVDMANVEPETFGEGGFQSPLHLLEWLSDHRPEEDLVLSHGDFCLPNIFIAGGKLAGFIDLGRTGVADRWQDIALCYRSLKHNYSGAYSGKAYSGFDPDLLFEALELEPNWEKLNYYILLDELF